MYEEVHIFSCYWTMNYYKLFVLSQPHPHPGASDPLYLLPLLLMSDAGSRQEMIILKLFWLKALGVVSLSLSLSLTLLYVRENYFRSIFFPCLFVNLIYYLFLSIIAFVIFSLPIGLLFLLPCLLPWLHAHAKIFFVLMPVHVYSLVGIYMPVYHFLNFLSCTPIPLFILEFISSFVSLLQLSLCFFICRYLSIILPR